MGNLRLVVVVGAALLVSGGSACGGAVEGEPSGGDAAPKPDRTTPTSVIPSAVPDGGRDAVAGEAGEAAADGGQASLDGGNAGDAREDTTSRTVVDSALVDVADAGDAETGSVRSNPGFLSCPTPTPVVLGGQMTGYVECADSGVFYRVETTACPVLLPRVSSACLVRNQVDGGAGCATDSDCVLKPLGTCGRGAGRFGPCACSYGCVHDSDCMSGEICQCGDPVGACVPASCRLSSDCASGSLCASSPVGWGGCSWFPLPQVYACEASGDACLTSSDCRSANASACGMSVDSGIRGCGPPQLLCPGAPPAN